MESDHFGNAFFKTGFKQLLSLILIGLLTGHSFIFAVPPGATSGDRHLSPISSLWDKDSAKVEKMATLAVNLLATVIIGAFVYEVLLPFVSFFWPQVLPSLIPIPYVIAVYAKIMILNAIATFIVIQHFFGDYPRDDISSAMDSAFASDSIPVYDYWGTQYRQNQWFMFFVSLAVSSFVAHASLTSGRVPSNSAYEKMALEYRIGMYGHQPSVAPPPMKPTPRVILPAVQDAHRSA